MVSMVPVSSKSTKAPAPVDKGAKLVMSTFATGGETEAPETTVGLDIGMSIIAPGDKTETLTIGGAKKFGNSSLIMIVAPAVTRDPLAPIGTEPVDVVPSRFPGATTNPEMKHIKVVYTSISTGSITVIID